MCSISRLAGRLSKEAINGIAVSKPNCHGEAFSSAAKRVSGAPVTVVFDPLMCPQGAQRRVPVYLGVVFLLHPMLGWVATAMVVACGSDDPAVEVPSSTADAGTLGFDAGTPKSDAGTGAQDAAAPPPAPKTYAIGGTVLALGTGAHLGAGRAFVAEADESDGSFLRYAPRVAIVTNVEEDHLAHYSGLAEILDAFEAFTGTLSARWSYDSTPIWQKRFTYAYGIQLLGSVEEDFVR